MDLNRETTEGLLGLDRAASALADIARGPFVNM
jgi:hypothetical protein